MICDFHTHLLPNMDDGASSVEEALRLLSALAAQGLEAVCATPHYLPHREPVKDFLARRAACAAALADGMRRNGGAFPRVILGAEVRIEAGMERIPDLSQLAYTGTDRILLEFPYKSYQNVLVEEVYNLCYTHRLRPVIAHPNRYYDFFSAAELERVLAISGAVMQFNLETFHHLRATSFFRSTARRAAVVFGCDLHGDSSLAALRLPRVLKAAARALPDKPAVELADRERNFLARAVSLL